MGISGAYPLFEKKVPSGISQVGRAGIEGRILAVDVSGLLYKFSYGDQPEDQLYIERFVRYHHMICSSGCIPVYVLDGKSPEEKKHTSEKRAKIYEQSRVRVQTAKANLEAAQGLYETSLSSRSSLPVDRDESPDATPPPQSLASGGDDAALPPMPELSALEKVEAAEVAYKRASLRIIDVCRTKTKILVKILRALGAVVLHAKGEAEGACSVLNHLGFVDGIISDDSDVFAFGGLELYRNISLESIRRGTVKKYDIKRILSFLGLNQSKFVDVAILAGCDFTQTKISGVGIATAVRFIKLFQNIEGITANKAVISIRNVPLVVPPLEEFNYPAARNIFMRHVGATDPREFFECETISPSDESYLDSASDASGSSSGSGGSIITHKRKNTRQDKRSESGDSLRNQSFDSLWKAEHANDTNNPLGYGPMCRQNNIDVRRVERLVELTTKPPNPESSPLYADIVERYITSGDLARSILDDLAYTLDLDVPSKHAVVI